MKEREQRLSPQVQLAHVLDNPFDKNAISISVGQDQKFFDIGWIPMSHNKTILEVGIENVDAGMEDFTSYKGEIQGVRISVWERAKQICS